MRLVRAAKHRCGLPSWARHGEIVECDHCGRRWKYVEPGNPAFNGWRRTVPDMFGSRFWRTIFGAL